MPCGLVPKITRYYKLISLWSMGHLRLSKISLSLNFKNKQWWYQICPEIEVSALLSQTSSFLTPTCDVGSEVGFISYCSGLQAPGPPWRKLAQSQSALQLWSFCEWMCSILSSNNPTLISYHGLCFIPGPPLIRYGKWFSLKLPHLSTRIVTGYASWDLLWGLN